MSATEFKAKCLKVFDDLSKKRAHKVTVTKRGKPVAVVTPASAALMGENVFGSLRGMVVAPPDFDFTQPALDVPFEGDDTLLKDER
jgi:prevent-host-death family protein